ncbi:efflux RND transporter permease subunit [Corallincola platygyrae]|uniref:Efflux RND transporter permease subunit n=1 Tax=Corallincola platygyrae TaxID=1193278 RepID=A0ABW4XNL2_9GAMM
MDTRKGIIAWFARNSVAANLLMAVLLIGGLVSAFTIQREVFPQITLNLISVEVPYPGAAPQEVEEGINIRIEEAIEDITGIKKITSRASEGIGSLTIEVEDDFDIGEVLDEVKLRIDAISSFPENIEKPIIYKQQAEEQVIFVQVYGNLDEIAMKELTKSVREEIIALPGITSAEIWGAREYEVAIEISEGRLREYGLTFDDVVRAVRNSSLDLPGGAIKTRTGDILLRAKGQAYYGHEFNDLVLMTRPDGSRLLLSDVAMINDGFTEIERFSEFDRMPSMSVAVNSVGDQDALHISKVVNEYVEEKRESLPEGISIATWGDNAFYLQGRLDLMVNNMVWGGLLVFIVLSAFLRLRLAFWVLMGLPVCFLGSMLLMPVEPIGVTINMLSLFGFILVLGIVVDDAIIIGESAYSEIEKYGHNTENVIRGAQRVAMPATFGVLTTIAAFTPMLMVAGPFGVIWKTIGLVVILCLVFSLVESKLILPAHLVHMKVTEDNPHTRNPITRFRLFCSGWMARFVKSVYLPVLARAVEYRYVTMTLFISGLMLIGASVAGGYVRSVFFPDLPSDFIRAEVNMVDGAPSEATASALRVMTDALYRMDQEVQQETGSGVVKHNIAFLRSSGTSGVIWVELSKGEDRETDGYEIANLWREQMPEVSGVRDLKFDGSINQGPGADIAFKLIGKDLVMLGQAAEELKFRLADFDGVYDISDDSSGGKEEIVLSIKPQAEALGLSLLDLARQVRQGFYGAEAQRVQRGSDEVKIMVRYPREERRSITDLENMRIRTATGDEVPFSAVAEIEMSQGYSRITRVDGIRAITVTASADKTRVEPSKISKEVEENILPELLSKYPGVKSALEGATLEEQKALVGLLKGAFLALFAIYALMAIPLKSYAQPIVIMAVIPFGIIGAIFGHMLLGLPMSVLSLCGIIALSGVVVNDSLIMVDFINQARAEGYRLTDAVLSAGAKRFRAIVLTSLTTFFGLIPIILEKSLQAQIVIPMAVSLAFGILFATVITLFLIPCLYLVLSDIKGLFGRVKRIYVSDEKPAEVTD